MIAFITLLCCAFQAQAAKADVTPVEKVVQMIRDLQTQVQEEGTAEATTYDKFACFCKSKTDEKSNKKVITALLSQPDVPVSDYDFHSGDIIKTLEGLLNEFRQSRTDLESDEAQSKSDYNLAMQAKLDVLKQAQLSLENAQKDRAKTTEAIATANEDLTATNAQLNDDRVYLKDLTAKCETKAKEWDQRSAMRADELAALTQALAVLESTVATKAGATGSGGRGKASVPRRWRPRTTPRTT